MVDEQSSYSIVRSTAIVMIITIAVKLLGFGEKVILAYYFGTGIEIDSFLIAFSIPYMIYLIVRDIIQPAFLPTFMQRIKLKEDRYDWRLFNIVLTILFILILIIMVLCIVFTPIIIKIFAPGFKEAKRILTIQLTRIVLPASLFLSISALTYSTLNSLKKFALPATADIAFKGFGILVLFLFFNYFGVFGLAVGVVTGACFRMLIHLFGLRKRWENMKPSIDVSYVPLKKMCNLITPLMVGIIFAQISLIIDNIFASTLETGSVSALAYSKKIIEMPVIVLPYALGIVIFPYFSELAIKRNLNELMELLIRSIKFLSYIFIPIIFITALLREPIVETLFERGAFDFRSTKLTSSALLFYSFGLFSFAIEILLVKLYFSMSDTKTPITVGILCVLLNVFFTYILIKFMYHNGIAFALTISKSVKVAALYILLKRKFVDIKVYSTLKYILKIFISALIMAVLLYFLNINLWDARIANTLIKFVILFSFVSIGIVIFIISTFLMKVEEATQYLLYAKRNIGRIFRYNCLLQ